MIKYSNKKNNIEIIISKKRGTITFLEDSKDNKTLEQLSEDLKEIGDILSLQKIPRSIRGELEYVIRIKLNLSKKGDSLLRLMEDAAEKYAALKNREKAISDARRLRKYLGNWKKGSPKLRASVGEDMRRIYGVLEEFEISRRDVYDRHKKGSSYKARKAIIAALSIKYPQLSKSSVARIIKKEHAIVYLAMREHGSKVKKYNQNSDIRVMFKEIFTQNI